MERSRRTFGPGMVLLGCLLFYLVVFSLYWAGIPTPCRVGQAPAPPAAAMVCRWRFVGYEPSPFEAVWSENAAAWDARLCDKMKEEPHLTNSKLILRRVAHLTGNQGVKDLPPLQPAEVQAADDLMSKMHYALTCRLADEADDDEKEKEEEGNMKKKKVVVEEVMAMGVQLIEPLWGWLRDPFDVYCREKRYEWKAWNGELRQSKAHILPLTSAPYYVERVSAAIAAAADDDDDTRQLVGRVVPSSKWSADGLAPWHRGGKETKKIMLDLGSSYFLSWGQYKTAVSGRWFYDNYHQRGVKFDRFVAVEVTPIDTAKAYEQLPPDLVGAYTIINAPLSFRTDSNLDVDRLLDNLATPDDMVILKLDIDSAKLETDLSWALAEEAELASMIDEMMFEHHVDIDIMRRSWGNQTESLSDSYRLFTNLRKNGIRSHSWP